MKNIIIISIVLLIVTGSKCKKTVEYVYTSEFEIQNQSDTGLTIKTWSHNIPVKNIYINKSASFSDKEVGESPMTPSQFLGGDSLEIIFDDAKKLTYTWFRISATSKNILQNEWDIIKIEERHTKNLYKITKEHRDSAG